MKTKALFVMLCTATCLMMSEKETPEAPLPSATSKQAPRVFHLPCPPHHT